VTSYPSVFMFDVVAWCVAGDQGEEVKLAQIRDRFYDMAVQCKSVICCRMTPFQKAKIVEEVKRRKGMMVFSEYTSP
jgi:magnesium-transporting ATPase (P-type)